MEECASMRGGFSPSGETLARARSALRTAVGRFAGVHVELLALIWFGAALATTLWVWGLNPLTFQGDEAVNRMAAALIVERGRPLVEVPLSDPEDLLHMHEWMTIGSYALPIYPPVLFYLYGWLLKLGVVGQFVISALPASGAAAFVYGTAQLLPAGRRWLALPAPLLGMPALYWLLRPWANISLVLTSLCWGFCWWTIWRERKATGYLAAALFSVGVAAATRPDFAAHPLTVAMLLALAVAPRKYPAILALVVASGLCAVTANLLLNRAVSGTSFRPVYEAVLDRDHGVASAGSLGLLLRLWFPMGVPSIDETLKLIHRYWIELGQLKWLLAAQLTIIPLFFRVGWLSRACYLLVLLILLLFLFSHVHWELFGVTDPTPLSEHSVPRYWTPLYLFAALPPILALGRVRSRSLLAVGAVLAGLLSWSTVYGIYKTQRTTYPALRQLVHGSPRVLDALSRHVPKDAIVFSWSRHGTLWSRFRRMGLIGEPVPTAESMNRCVQADIPVYVYGPYPLHVQRRLQRELSRRRLLMVPVDRNLGLFRIQRRS